MSVLNLRAEVLRCFKSLHRVRKSIFHEDAFALQLGREKINEEFKKHKNVTNTTSIEELIKQAIAVENELKTTVIQAKEVKPGVYEARIRPETVRLTNVPFKDLT